MNALMRLLAGRRDRDGESPVFDMDATGLPAALLDPALAAIEPTVAGDRRQRALSTAEDIIRETLAQKVLQGWLQNRHQTLLPLTVNFRRLGEEDSRLLVGVMAAAILAGSEADAFERGGAMSFLKDHGATEATLAAFDTALVNPEPFSRLFAKILAGHDLGPLAFIMVAVVADARVVADQLLLQWVAAKLDLPNTVVRSVERRYRH